MPSVHVDLQSLRTELAGVAGTVQHMQDRITTILQRIEEENKVQQSRITELELSNRETLAAAKWLRVQNVDLERKVNEQKPDLQNAIDARNKAFKKLQHARRVIRDLLDEKSAGLNLLAPGAQLSTASTENLHANEHIPSFTAATTDDGSNDSGSESTARLGSSVSTSRQIPLASSYRADPDHNVAGPSLLSGRLSTQDQGGVLLEDVTVGQSVGPHSPKPISESGRPIKPVPSPTYSETLKIHYSRLPKTVEIACGPMSWSGLYAKLKLDETQASSLESLALMPDPSLRLQVINDLVFVYDPIILESQTTSYVIDWGLKNINQRIRRYITQLGSDTFHTFFFPRKRDAWFYIGAHTWTVSELKPLWPSLGPKSRQLVTGRLAERSGGALVQQHLTQQLDDEELVQLCIEISSQSHGQRSREYAMSIGYRPGKAAALAQVPIAGPSTSGIVTSRPEEGE